MAVLYQTTGPDVKPDGAIGWFARAARCPYNPWHMQHENIKQSLQNLSARIIAIRDSL